MLARFSKDTDKLTMILEGNIDESTTDAFSGKLSEAIADNYDNVFIDMEHVGYISSIGIGALMLAHKKAVKSGKRIIIENISSKAHDLLNVVGVLPLFTLTDK